MQDEVPSLNLVLKHVRSSSIHMWIAKLESTKADRSETDHAQPNQGLHREM